jgi:hypothetical protein
VGMSQYGVHTILKKSDGTTEVAYRPFSTLEMCKPECERAKQFYVDMKVYECTGRSCWYKGCPNAI